MKKIILTLLLLLTLTSCGEENSVEEEQNVQEVIQQEIISDKQSDKTDEVFNNEIIEEDNVEDLIEEIFSIEESEPEIVEEEIQEEEEIDTEKHSIEEEIILEEPEIIEEVKPETPVIEVEAESQETEKSVFSLEEVLDVCQSECGSNQDLYCSEYKTFLSTSGSEITGTCRTFSKKNRNFRKCQGFCQSLGQNNIQCSNADGSVNYRCN